MMYSIVIWPVKFIMNDSQTIGLGLLGLAVLFFILGVLFLLDRPLLILSNILLFMGVIILMGIREFLKFTIQKGRGHGSIAFFLGITLIFCKLPLPGILCEVVGAYWLFGGFWPMLLSLLWKFPFVASIFPFFAKAKDDQPRDMGSTL
jgi:hypothetical protein